MDVNHHLVEQARRFITGANVHMVGTWILCYEICAKDARRQIYEDLLRNFVRSKQKLLKSAKQNPVSRISPDELAVASAAIHRRIEKLLTSHSD